MSAAERDALAVCVDCAMLAANDDDSGAADGARDRYADGMEEWRAAMGGDVVCVVSTDEDSRHFRNRGPCDVCGTMLGGDYYAATIISMNGGAS